MAYASYWRKQPSKVGVRPIKGLVTPPPESAKINTHCHACITLVLALVYCNFHTGG